jgi:2-polyprenyl-6-methoxyphenol hydroxylase-like FAD-dependent oxidoreductase
LKAIVVGGGIGGLCAALALRRAGLDVEVFERAAELADVGAGISLWANAFRALDHLGVAAAVRAIGQSAAGALRTPDGRLLSEPGPDLIARHPDFCRVVHRAELHRVLVDALGPDVLRLDASCRSVAEQDGGVGVSLANGSRIAADLLIGADGLRSLVRAHLHGEAPPVYAGYTAWRGVTSLEPARLAPGETWGRGIRFGQMPLTRGRVYWFAAANAPAGARSADGERNELLRRFRGWHAPIEELIDGTPEERILRNDIYDRPPLPAWGRGRMTLLGDAAHPMTPNLGQGACQAIEDAVVLGRCLTLNSDLVAALREYERRRRTRTDPIVRQSRQVGRVAQWQHPLAVTVRDLAVRRLPPAIEARQLEAVIGYDAAIAAESV